MNRSPGHEQDYAFGQLMLTLRTAIGLTQSGLAEYLGVSRRAVGEWEAGNSYPKAERLKSLITLAIKQKAFSPGHEPEEVRALWSTARQKVILDEAWLASLLSAPQPEPARTRTGTNAGTPLPREVGPRISWGDSRAVSHFYGREWELDTLEQWVVSERCRVLSLLGLGGIGKSALSVSLMHRVAEHFDVVIWRSVRDAPTCEGLIAECLQVLEPLVPRASTTGLDAQINLLLAHLRNSRVLLVLDNMESLLEEGERSGHLHAGYESYGRLLRRVAETNHNSCLLLTSREKLADLAFYEGSHSPVRVMRLGRLDVAACERLLAEKGVEGTEQERTGLIEAYTGNPLALKIVGQTIVDLFSGDVASFIEQGETIYGGIRQLLAEQFNRLSPAQQSIMFWLALLREPCTLDQLSSLFATPVPRVWLLEGLEALNRRSLIEPGASQRPDGSKLGSFTLQSVVLEYLTARLIAELSEEINGGRQAWLVEQGLEIAQVSEHVRQTQRRLIVAPVLANLLGSLGGASAVERHLLGLLTQLRTQPADAQGYGPANLLVLLREMKGHLSGLDLSRLSIRGSYLQGVEMRNTSLAGATIRDTIFTETYGAVLSVVIASTGKYWIAATESGEILVWEAGGPTMRRLWQIDTHKVWRLAISADGEKLAGGSWDGTVSLWNIADGTLLWSSEHDTNLRMIHGLEFSPDGRLVASSGNDTLVRIWDVRNGAQLHVLSHASPVRSVAWSPDGRLLATGDMDGSIRLWTPEEPMLAPLQTLQGHTQAVTSLAFSPDGGMLASASWDTTVRVWATEGPDEWSLRTTLSGHTDLLQRVAWSPDGRTVASGGFDKTIRLWDVEAGSYRLALHGHTSVVRGLAFTPDSTTLLSGGEDGTMRVWDVGSGQSIRVMQGYVSSVNEIDWSPDGAHVVAASSDRLLTILDLKRKVSLRVLSGHGAALYGVAWSPDGRWLASTEASNAIRLWDPSTGEGLFTIQDVDDPGNIYLNVAWSPDGHWLAAGTNRHGVRVFGSSAGHPQRWAGDAPHDSSISYITSYIAWSPDGTRVAGGSEEGTVYIWDAESGSLIRQMTGHNGGISGLSWSPEGTLLASASSGKGGELFVWNPESGELVRALEAEPRPTSTGAVEWGTTDEELVSVDSSGTLRWWSVGRGECIRVREADQEMVMSIAKSPDGKTLATCGSNGTIMLWDLQSGEQTETLRRDRPYERLDVTGIRGLTAAQQSALYALGAFEGIGNAERTEHV